MRIQEGPNTILTTCTKMTEEVERRHGVNGNSSGTISEDAPVSSPAPGGRLKFFKDGKFILELVRMSGGGGGGSGGAAAGREAGGWVSVPRKTFWPPAPPHAPHTPPAHTPPATSLSVSDDNSSIQSSPWQRDHCWKQATPRKGVSRELAMYYCRPSSLPRAAILAGSRLLRRRPYRAPPASAHPPPPLSNGVCHATNGAADKEEEQWEESDRERRAFLHMKLKKPPHKLRVYSKTRAGAPARALQPVLERLRARAAPSVAAGGAASGAASVAVNAKVASCRRGEEHAMVSPRKRILRELERVSLEEGSKRRARPAPSLSTASYPPPAPGPSRRAAGSSSAGGGSSSGGGGSRHHGSYSIQSLLSMGDGEARAKPESPASAPSASPDLSPSPPHYRYRAGSSGVSPGGAGSSGSGARLSPEGLRSSSAGGSAAPGARLPPLPPAHWPHPAPHPLHAHHAHSGMGGHRGALGAGAGAGAGAGVSGVPEWPVLWAGWAVPRPLWLGYGWPPPPPATHSPHSAHSPHSSAPHHPHHPHAAPHHPHHPLSPLHHPHAALHHPPQQHLDDHNADMPLNLSKH